MKQSMGAGDTGKTRVLKHCIDKASPLIALIGHLDELNSFIGFSRSLLNAQKREELRDLDEMLKEVQNHIFLISSELAGAKLKVKIGKREVEWLENVINKLEKELNQYPISFIQMVAYLLPLCMLLEQSVEKSKE